MKTIEQYEKILKKDKSLTVELRQETKTRKAIYVLTPDPFATRKYMVNEVGPKFGITFAVPRKTKADGYTLGIVQDDTDEVYVIKLKKGGQYQRGRENELGFQGYVQKQLDEHGRCKLTISDNYGKVVKLDVVGVKDASKKHGQLNRTDTTLTLRDGSTYGISHKKKNANIVTKIKKMLADIRFNLEQRLRNYAKANGIKPGEYMSVRVTNRDFIKLCWFGTDISTGAVFIGDFESMDSNNVQIERIIEQGDDDVLDFYPMYVKWKIANSTYKMQFFGVVLDTYGNVIKDLEMPGINAPLPSGRKLKTGQEEPKKRRKRRKRRRVTEDLADEQLMEEARRNDMWDTVAYCAENHKMLWLKYRTVEDGSIISRKVAPYSYRTRNTQVRGRSTYFYADDFTPGQEHGIKCFLIENCLQVKESN